MRLAPHWYATDADVIKTYVRLGLGIGILAEMAYDPELDKDLVACPGASYSTLRDLHCLRRGTFLRRYMYEFLELFAPQLSADQVDAAVAAPDRASREALFEGIHRLSVKTEPCRSVSQGRGRTKLNPFSA